uniref:Uncharacterized protein MANES_06G065800 n=1 Tax=Rhizophora mucronata TaxID=61149 RepID=A0A2P2K0S4_RHIMU
MITPEILQSKRSRNKPGHEILNKVCFSSWIKRQISRHFSYLCFKLILIHPEDIFPSRLKCMITVIQAFT